MGNLPENEAPKVVRRSQRFFIMNDVLWRKNGDKPPLLVILNQNVRMWIAQEVHDDSGHQGWDLTFHKICDSYWWPNQYIFVTAFCHSCHECQMRSTYWNTIPLQLQYI